MSLCHLAVTNLLFIFQIGLIQLNASIVFQIDSRGLVQMIKCYNIYEGSVQFFSIPQKRITKRAHGYLKYGSKSLTLTI